VRRGLRRLWSALWAARPDRELRREIAGHLALMVDDLERRGYSRQEAELEARRRFGSIALATDAQRDERSWTWLEDARRDLGVALRMLRRSPGFATVAVLTLAVGIGANTVVFTVTNAVLFKGFPLVAGNDRLVYITSSPGCCVSSVDFRDWQAQAQTLSEMALVHGIAGTISEAGKGAEIVAATEVTANTFRVAGQRPLLGRDFSAADEQPGAPAVVILRYGLWQRRFAGDPAVIGRRMRVNDRLATVIGVMPRGFSFPQNQDLWLPLIITGTEPRDDRPNWFALGRMADGVELQHVRTELAEIGRRLGRQYPETNQGRSLVPTVSTFEDFFVGAKAGAIYRAMWGAVGFVLLIACANMANLLLARALARSREISVRMAIGAGRGRVLRQLLLESLVLSTIGGLVGWVLAHGGVTAYAAAANGSGMSEQTLGVWFMDVLDYSMDYRAFAYLAGISVTTGLVFGLVPALRLSQRGPCGGLTASTRGMSMDRRTRRLSWALVASEMTLAVVLVAGSGMLLRTFWVLYAADPGFDPSRVVAAQVSLSGTRYADPVSRTALIDRVIGEAHSVTGVTAAGTASALPGWLLAPREFEIDGGAADARRRPLVGVVTVGGDYFGALGLRVSDGRDFLPTDDADGTPVAIVNESFARRYLPGGAVGRRLRLFARASPDVWMTIVGVAPSVAQNRELQQRDPVVYLPARARPIASPWILARTNTPLAPVAAELRRRIVAADSELPLADSPAPLGDRLARNYQFRGVVTILFGLFAVIALLLAAVGLYAVSAHSVSERTREIGIRAAIGATRLDVLRLVLRDGGRAVAAGLFGGLAAALLLGHVLKAEFAQVAPSDPLMLIAALLILLLAALVGCVVPARRALRVDPGVVLRPAD
jgi:putative ABC transport system permease protein